MVLRDELVRHVGGAPGGVQLALIERAVQLKLRLIGMDLTFAETGAMSAHAARTYLAWSNSFTRTLAVLGLHPAKEPPPPLADVLSAARTRQDVRPAAELPAAVSHAIPRTAPDGRD